MAQWTGKKARARRQELGGADTCDNLGKDSRTGGEGEVGEGGAAAIGQEW